MPQNININFNVNGKITSDNLKRIQTGLKGVASQSGAIKKTNANLKQLQINTGGLANTLKGAVGNVTAFIGAYAGFNAIIGATRNIIEFNRSVAEIQTIAKVSGPRLLEIKKGLIDVSNATGKSVTQAARTFYQIQSAGITDVAEAQKVLNASMKLSVGSLADAETTTLALTKSMAVYGDQIKDVTVFSDTLFRGVELGQTNMQELASSIPQVLGPARAMGVSFKDLVGQIASFSKRAGSTSQAVTQLNSIFTAVAKKQATAKTVLGENAKLFSVQALRAKGLTKFMKDLSEATGNNVETLNKLFGRKEATSGFLSAAADGFKDLTDTVKSNNNTLGASDEAFKKIVNSIGGQIDILREKSKNIFIKLAVSGEAGVTETLKVINGLISTIDENFKRIARVATIFFTSVLIAKGVTAFKVLKGQFISFKVQAINAGTTANISFLKWIGTMKLANVAMKTLTIGTKVLKASLTLGLSLALDFLIEKILTLKEELNGFSGVWELIKINASIAFKKIEAILVGLGIKISETMAIAERAISKVLGNPPPTKLSESINKQKKSLGQLTVEISKLNKEKDKLFKGPAQNGLQAAVSNVQGQLKSPAGSGGDGGTETPKTGVVDSTVTQTQAALKEKARLEIEFALLKNEREQLQADKDFAFLQEKLGTEEALRRTAAKQSALAVEKDENKKKLIIITAEKDLAKQRAKITKADVKFSELSNKEKLQQTSNTLGLAVNLARAGGKKFFAITKALSLSEAVVSGTLAVQKALASAPPPLNFINASLVGATTALNVAKIAGSKPPAFRTGGIIGGATVAGDNQILQSQVGSREMMLSRPQQSNLFNGIKNGTLGGGNEAVLEAINNLTNAIMDQSIQVVADGREIALLVRDQVRSGVRLV